MEATFEFNNQFVPQSLVQIKNVGDFALEGTNDEGYYFYLVVKTTLGQFESASFGPLLPDSFEVIPGYQVQYTQDEYNEKKLTKLISTWLNDRNKKLTEAKLVEYQEAIDNMVDLQGYLYSLDTSVHDFRDGDE